MRSLARHGWSGGFGAEWTVVTSRGRTLALFIFVIVGIWALPASNAKADLQAGCTQSGATVTCSYTTQGQRASVEVAEPVLLLAMPETDVVRGTRPAFVSERAPDSPRP
jgi:hypothetical protein